MSTSSYQHTISDGPALDQMLDSLKYASTRQKITVCFRVGRIGESSFVIETIITGIRHQPGSTGAFLFQANVLDGGKGKIEGYYKPQKREGTFKVS